MAAQPDESTPPFKDYCLILQLHPEADAEMVDAAYWHLARRYSDARRTDPSAKAKMDDLNEAYSVLRSPTRREEYLRIRNAVLGKGALPAAPQPVPQAPPLAVMEKQRPRPPERSPDEEGVTLHRPGPFWLSLPRMSFAQVTLPPWQNTLVALVFLGLAITALLAGADPVLVMTPLALSIVVASVPVFRRLLRPPRLPRLALGALSIRTPCTMVSSTHRLSPDAIRQSTKEMRTRLREGSGPQAASTTTSASPRSSSAPSQDVDSDPPVG